MATKKATKKSATSKKEIAYRSIGQNVILVIDGKKVTKRMKLKKDREALKTKVEAYNKRNSIKKETEIISIMQEGKTTEKQRTEKAKTESKGKVKKEVKAKKVTKADIEKAKKLLEDNDYRVTAKSVPQERQRSAGKHREY
jgi:hypothetical protein